MVTRSRAARLLVGLVPAAFLLLAARPPGGASSAGGPCRDRPQPAVSGPFAIRAVVVQNEGKVRDVLPLLAGLSANTLVTHAAPDPSTGTAARARRLRYIAWMTTEEIDLAASDPAAAARLASVPGLSGVYYEDAAAVEGYTTPEDQRRAYGELKAIRPDLLVLHPLRLDPIAWDPGYLDRVFRPELTDMLVPYYYPVGSTGFGSFQEEDPWEAVLVPFLSEVARRAPDKPVLPVLQGFEQIGYPVGADFPERQLALYRTVWPEISSAAMFEWGLSEDDAPLVGLGFRPSLAAGVRALFRNLALEERGLQPCIPKRTAVRSRLRRLSL